MQDYLPPAVQDHFLAIVAEFVLLPWREALRSVLADASQGGSQARPREKHWTLDMGGMLMSGRARSGPALLGFPLDAWGVQCGVYARCQRRPLACDAHMTSAVLLTCASGGDSQVVSTCFSGHTS